MTERSGGRSFRLVWAGLIALFFLFCGVGWHLWQRFLRFERVVAAHVPADAALAVRVETEHRVLFDPTYKQLFPLIDRAFAGARTASLPSRRERLERRGGLALAAELREVLYARTAGGDWLVAIGGRFPKVGVGPALASVFADEGLVVSEYTPGAWQLPGAVFAQASDGAVLFASSRGTLASSLAPGDGAARLGLPGEGAGALAFRGDALGAAGAAGSPIGRALGPVRRGTLRLKINEPSLLFSGDLELADAASATASCAALDLARALGPLAATLAGGDARSCLDSALETGRWTAQGARVELAFSLPITEVNRDLGRLAQAAASATRAGAPL